MFKWFKKRAIKSEETKQGATKVETYDKAIARITVYNKALAYPIAEYEIKQSETHLIGSICGMYPKARYNVNVLRY